MEKTKLQEYCHKKNIELPKYDTRRIGGEAHCPIFQCDLICDRKTVTALGPTKKEAEASAARLILDNKTEEKKRKLPDDYTILLDLENIKYEPFDWEGSTLLGFVSKSHPLSKGLDIPIQYVSSSRADAVDLAIVIHAAQLAPDTPVIIVTRDHFGDTLCDLLPNVITYPSISVMLDCLCDPFMMVYKEITGVLHESLLSAVKKFFHYVSMSSTPGINAKSNDLVLNWSDHYLEFFFEDDYEDTLDIGIIINRAHTPERSFHYPEELDAATEYFRQINKTDA